MTFAELLKQGTGHALLFIPSAVLLGALHGLEPGHSKTMMAAFIVAIRGTVSQAALLGLAATVSHTAVVWAVALAGLHFGKALDNERTEHYFQIASALLIVAVALWMLWRTYREHLREKIELDGNHSHHVHDHAAVHSIDLGHGDVAVLEIFEHGVPPRFRITFDGSSTHTLLSDPNRVEVETQRSDGSAQRFAFVRKETFLESIDEVPEPHEFIARLHVGHDGLHHDYDVRFEETAHPHVHEGLDVATAGYQDAHEQAHANDIRRRFAGREVTTAQIIWFGLVGGLVPCPASITVLLLCLQLKQFTLGVTLVLCFSIGLALTMVVSGALAALSVRYASRRWTGFGALARRAPYVSSALILAVGAYTGYLGWMGLVR